MLDRRNSDLESLRAHRGALNGRLVRLQAERTRLRAAEDAETEALAAIGELGRAEVDAIRAWASTGAPGPAPGIDAAKRTKLMADLVTAQAAAEAARAAIGDVDQELAAVSREAAGLAEQIEMAAVAEMMDRFGADLAEVKAGAAELRAGIAKLMAITVALFERADQHEDLGRVDAAMQIRRVLQPLLGAVKVDVGPTVAEVHAFKAAHAEHFAALIR